MHAAKDSYWKLQPAQRHWRPPRRRGLPRGIVLPAWAIYILPIPLARWLAPPALNVLLAHGVWPGFRGIVSSAWAFQSIASPVALVLLLAGDFLLRRIPFFLLRSESGWRGRRPLRCS